MYKDKNGFTIVELLIVIVVIGILAAITIVAFNGVQTRARDTDRSTDIMSISKKLEVFYAANGYYPNTTNMLDANYRKNVLELPDAITTSPGGGAPINYCWDTTVNQYCYVALHPVGDCTLVNDKCTAYILRYVLESNPSLHINKLSANER